MHFAILYAPLCAQRPPAQRLRARPTPAPGPGLARAAGLYRPAGQASPGPRAGRQGGRGARVPAPPGVEWPVQDQVQDRLEGHSASIRTVRSGNLSTFLA